MKIFVTESLIIRVADYNSTKLTKSDSTKGMIVGTVQFLEFLDLSVLLTKFLGRSWSGLY